MTEVTIWTDGACSGNPGPGGWAAVLRCGEAEKVLSGGERVTTNNRMELTAVISALEALKRPCTVTLYSDSKYIVDAMTQGWVYAWKQKGWMRTNREPAKNPELWEALLEQVKRHQVTFCWVKGHADNEINARCDALAVQESKKYKSY